MKYALQFLILVWWFGGMAVANGFWSTLLAIVMPPWAMYLVVERVFNMLGVI